MRGEIKLIILGILFIITIFFLGYFIRGWVDYSERNYHGFWADNYNESEVYEFLYEKDPVGDWICINIKGMDIQTMLETCNHEVGHEIFARSCEKGINKCWGFE